MPKKITSSESIAKQRATSANNRNKTASFETVLNELEQIVTRLESGELPLENALNEFEHGVKLAKQSQQTLLQAEQRVQILLSDDVGKPLTPFIADPEEAR
ncbi:exodeoxyribonuclease VII small subunit [Candidatus Fukatsuia symbiotica]|uniref:Exodeoxyribonuclease 7 small subunit n=1 Tax=Candidatus Fukatsuia symbiotica TaxID=1878942 RepID=A0A2Y9CKD7_9GAMM|nr:exodeoxyribonuclease VII small subunit [Candidatus Fukatsuia symbiotica]AWK15339.1 exodeoxyribonuclease VII small subunit [Candidatus Fukatsuia symbiotica]MEA9445603.1 exodeoxyribonuclease VII small subunit [Candidatus Fukatsuia symbiotica]